LLLDDVFSELDPARSRALLGELPSTQALLTTAVPIPDGVAVARILDIRSLDGEVEWAVADPPRRRFRRRGEPDGPRPLGEGIEAAVERLGGGDAAAVGALFGRWRRSPGARSPSTWCRSG